MLASEVFRLLNVLIDGKARELVGTDVSIRYRCDQILKTETGSGFRENLRVSYERDKGDNVQLQLADIDHPLDSLVYLAGERKRLSKEINELQQIKLQLLNDWDFTRGDNRFQFQVFRPEMYKPFSQPRRPPHRRRPPHEPLCLLRRSPRRPSGQLLRMWWQIVKGPTTSGSPPPHVQASAGLTTTCENNMLIAT
jgi:hypothetical protein